MIMIMIMIIFIHTFSDSIVSWFIESFSSFFFLSEYHFYCASLILHLVTVLLVWQLPMFGIHFPFLSGQPPLLTILKVNLKPIILN